MTALPAVVEESAAVDCPRWFVGLLESALPALRRTVAAVVGDPSRRDDVVQDTVVRALGSWAGFDPARPMGPWLRRLAMASVDEIDRRERRSKEAEATVWRAVGEGPPGSDDHVVRLDDCRDVRAALGALRARDRALLHWRGARHLSYQETARLAGTTPVAARAALSRARRRFVAAYEATTAAGRGCLVAFAAALARRRARAARRGDAALERLLQVAAVPAALVAVVAVGAPAVVVLQAGAAPAAHVADAPADVATAAGRGVPEVLSAPAAGDPPPAGADAEARLAAAPHTGVRVAPTGAGAGADLGGDTAGAADAIWYQGVELRCDRSTVVGLTCAVLRTTPLGDGAEATVPTAPGS